MNTEIICSKSISLNSKVQLLPPQYQTEREIEAIKRDWRLVDKIGNSCYEIQKTDTGYLVITDWCKLPIEVNYLPHPKGFCGPANFELIFGDVVRTKPWIEGERSEVAPLPAPVITD